jgi:hypothetical protein
MVPLLSNGYGIYRSWSEKSYFLYWVVLEDLIGKVLLSTSCLTSTALSACTDCSDDFELISNLFGVWMVKGKPGLDDSVLEPYNSELSTNLSLRIESLQSQGIYCLSLPKPEVLQEIAEEFELFADLNGQSSLPQERLFTNRKFRVGNFWTQLDKFWLKDAWISVCSGKLPRVTVFYSDTENEVPLAGRTLRAYLALAFYLAAPWGWEGFSSTSESISFPVANVKQLRLCLSIMKRIFKTTDRWLLVAAPSSGTSNELQFSEPRDVVLQVAIETRFPYATALSIGEHEGIDSPTENQTEVHSTEESRLIIANTATINSVEFSEEELQKARDSGKLPKQFMPHLVEQVTLPTLQQQEGQAFIVLEGKQIPLGFSYAELLPVWSESILSPWVKSRLSSGKWSQVWWRGLAT